MKKVAISSTIPIEVPYAAGYSVFDLNNLFINSGKTDAMIELAHNRGLARTTCGWTKGVYAAAISNGFDKIINVVTGDCSNNHAMSEVLRVDGVNVIPFHYPYPRDRGELKDAITKLATFFGVTWSDVTNKFEEFRTLRSLMSRVDRLAVEGKVRGDEQLSYLISGSDMRGDPGTFKTELEKLIIRMEDRSPRNGIRIGIIGIPPMFTDLFTFLEEMGATIVYLETAVEFGRVGEFDDIVDTYYSYSYPYQLKLRIERIREEIEKREIEAIIHYTQSFCFHRNEHVLFERELRIPMLRIEGDLPGPMDESTRLRVETFITSLNKHEKRTFRPPILAMDIGSRSVKMLLYENGKESFEVMDTISFIRTFITGNQQKKVDPMEVVRNVFHRDPDTLEVVSTGYGRHQITGSNIKIVSEIEAHFRAIKNEFPHLNDYTILDMGGQDTKIIQVRDGMIEKFIMNDKCAAGGGRYLENMSKILEIPLERMGDYYEDPEFLNVTCAIFGETELVGKMIKGVEIHRLAAGVNWSVFKRSMFFLKKLFSPVLILSGGVALNRAIVRFFEESGEFEDVRVVRNPQTAGVRGLLYYVLDENIAKELV